jgi:benzoyl-CoA reductase/2-hydroxyglutaryl-CoA dehydratase subunit BcrC/BadD/HgdB
LPEPPVSDKRIDDLRIGITSTIPVEIVFAAGLEPVDLNNRFITSGDNKRLVEDAEGAGFPINFCAWIKGIYACARRSGIKRLIGVMEGDCSNTHLLLEILEEEGVEIVPFQYPLDRDAGRLRAAMERLANALGTTLERAEEVRQAMQPLRRKLERLDEMTWRDGTVTGVENHVWLINSSDMRGDWRRFEAELDTFLAEATKREPVKGGFRLGFVGIPPIIDDLYQALSSRGAYIVYNEFQRQFSTPGVFGNLIEQYLAYTYPYRTSQRAVDIAREARIRRLDGIVHYVQSFCFRQLQDRLIRRSTDVPVLTLEFDRPGRLDGRSITRVEAFLEVLERRRLSRDHKGVL